MTAPVSASEARNIAVLGAGTMGHGIAHVAALAGCSVRVYDVEASLAEAGIGKIRGNLDKGVSLGKLATADRDAALSRLGATGDLSAAVAGADVVIEAAPERVELKRDLFRRIDAIAPAHAIFATNTSSLSIADIATAVSRPESVVGMHFFNPVHLMKLVEIVRHSATSPEVVDTARALAERFGKTAIVVRDAPGFASSRLGIAIGLEAIRMVEQGVASAADIDTAMKLGYGHPMGPLELTDLVGLDVRLSIAEYLASTLGGNFTPPGLLREKVAAGKLGKKAGEGFYRWVDGKNTGPV